MQAEHQASREDCEEKRAQMQHLSEQEAKIFQFFLMPTNMF
jgi:hypothetical protein